MKPLLFIISIIACYLGCSPAHAGTKIMELEQVSLEAGIITSKRDPYIPEISGGIKPSPEDKTFHFTGEDESWRHRLDLNWDLNLLRTDYVALYWDNKITTHTTTKQFRTVQWFFDTGFDLGPVALFHRHMSAHVLESDGRDDGGFPLEDALMVRINLFK